MSKAIVVEPDAFRPGKTELGTLRHLQRIVGGRVEFVCPVGRDYEIIVNEEGILQDLPLNLVASMFSNTRLLGPAIFVGRSDDHGNITDIPEDVAEELLSLHKTVMRS